MDFFIDSGASENMVSKKGLHKNVRRVPERHIIFGDGKAVAATRVSDTRVFSSNVNYYILQFPVIHKEVLFVPSLEENI